VIEYDESCQMWHVTYSDKERWFASLTVAKIWLADEERRAKTEAKK